MQLDLEYILNTSPALVRFVEDVLQSGTGELCIEIY
jgi:hypothetical protein